MALFSTIFFAAAAAVAVTSGDAPDIRPDVSPSNTPAAVWAENNRARLDRLTAPEALRQVLESDKTAEALLTRVAGDGKASDPFVLVQIGAVTQFVMVPGAPTAHRARWTQALMRAVQRTSDEAYRPLFYLDQLRWCARSEQLPELRRLKAEATRRAVRDMAAIVIGEITHERH